MTFGFDVVSVPSVAVAGSDDRFAVIGPARPVGKVGRPDKRSIRLTVNGETKQEADLAGLVRSVLDRARRMKHRSEPSSAVSRRTRACGNDPVRASLPCRAPTRRGPARAPAD